MSLSIQVHRIVKERKGRGEYIPPHTHPFFHCIYVIGGFGRVQAGSQVIEAHRGLFLRIEPEVEHAIFGEDAMQSFDVKFSAQGAFLEPLSRLPLALPLNGYEHALMMNVFHLAIRGGDYAGALINARMTELLLLLLRREALRDDVDPAPPGQPGAALSPALAYIERHPREMPSVALLAELCGYTPAHFSTVFKQAFGRGPARYLQEKKIALAQERMMTTDCTVAELAEEAGMEPASFSRMFKRKTGISPSQYLRRANSDVGINLTPDSPYRPKQEFEIPKRR